MANYLNGQEYTVKINLSLYIYLLRRFFRQKVANKYLKYLGFVIISNYALYHNCVTITPYFAYVKIMIGNIQHDMTST